MRSSLIYCREFNTIRSADIESVGGKNASLGEMYSQLLSKGINVPDGFAITTTGFMRFIDFNQLQHPLAILMRQLDTSDFNNLQQVGSAARKLMMNATMPSDLEDAIRDSYYRLCSGTERAVAVRSSATAEDLPQASFAGQHESYLNISGADNLVLAVKKCFASLYTDRAIKYREDNHFPHDKVALSVGVQFMVRADKGCSGVAFTLEPESGFRNIIHISGVWGLGENIVQGTVTPDEFLVFKPTLRKGKHAIVQKKLGEKAKTMIYSNDASTPVVNVDTTPAMQQQFVLSDDEVKELAIWSLQIEEHYGRPMDIEWAKDGIDSKIYIIQARPETVQVNKNPLVLTEYVIEKNGDLLVQGQAVGNSVVSGKVRILQSPVEIDKVQQGDIIVTSTTSPDWDPVLRKAGAIVTDKGGRTSHASIVARELGVPAIVGCGNATTYLKDGKVVTVSCCEGKTGFVYRDAVPFHKQEVDFSQIQKPSNTKAMLIAGDPEQAFRLSFYPNDGVGLMRMEFIIARTIQVHPMALVRFHELPDTVAKSEIMELTKQYDDKKQYFIDHLVQGIATMAAAFYPKDVIVRFSDFKTNEYANLLGGAAFEPKEENPMIGFRGASRYYHPLYKEAFLLECEAIRKVRDEMGLTNVKVMIPFCRTVEEGRKVVRIMNDAGLEQSVNGLEVYVMIEIPSNVILAEQFAQLFDGFSIGSNDLTQLTLGIDRDSEVIGDVFSEEDNAVKQLITSVIAKAKGNAVKIGLCGQAPSDIPSYAAFLVAQGIDSISFNADALLKGIQNIYAAENAVPVPAY